ncbi:MAG: hypothetical protein MSK40_10370 [Parabacteroides sp.]|nr:hypothetical protein [Parabacteroides sp.]
MRRIVDARSNTSKYLKVNIESYSLSSELRISNISLGVTTLLTAGKCFVFPVTR